MWTLYKANKSNSGSLLTVSFNSKSKDKQGNDAEGALWINLVRQTSWNDETGKGGFKDGEKVNVKINLLEVGGMINALVNYDQPFKFFHGFDSNTTSGQFGYWEKDGEKGKIQGFGLSVNRGKDDKFKFSFSMGEAQAFLEFLRFATQHIFTGLYSIAKAKNEAYAESKNPAPKASPVKSGTKTTVKSSLKKAPVAEPEVTEEEANQELAATASEDSDF